MLEGRTVAQLKNVTFTVRATLDQSVRWKRAAEAEGHASAGTWLAAAADAYLKHQARAGRPLPLSWRLGIHPVRFESGEVLPVRGHVSPPFFTYRGGADRPYIYSRHFSLIYLPDGRLVASLRSYRQVRALAAELAAGLLRGSLPDSAEVVSRHQRASV
jgi:hypothetical protein